jgi:hypothetical protein
MQAQDASIELPTMADRDAGYIALANVMGPFRRMALYKRFGPMNAQSLLLRQAELLNLQAKLSACAAVDRDAGLDYDTNALSLIESKENDGNDEQWKLHLEIREKLDAYSISLNRCACCERYAADCRSRFCIVAAGKSAQATSA